MLGPGLGREYGSRAERPSWRLSHPASRSWGKYDHDVMEELGGFHHEMEDLTWFTLWWINSSTLADRDWKIGFN